MSRYEWESGTIRLPQAAVPGLRRALNESAAQHRLLIVEEVDALWRRIKDRPADKRAGAIPNYVVVPFNDPAGERRANALELDPASPGATDSKSLTSSAPDGRQCSTVHDARPGASHSRLSCDSSRSSTPGCDLHGNHCQPQPDSRDVGE